MKHDPHHLINKHPSALVRKSVRMRSKKRLTPLCFCLFECFGAEIRRLFLKIDSCLLLMALSLCLTTNPFHYRSQFPISRNFTSHEFLGRPRNLISINSKGE